MSSRKTDIRSQLVSNLGRPTLSRSRSRLRKTSIVSFGRSARCIDSLSLSLAIHNPRSRSRSRSLALRLSQSALRTPLSVRSRSTRTLARISHSALRIRYRTRSVLDSHSHPCPSSIARFRRQFDLIVVSQLGHSYVDARGRCSCSRSYPGRSLRFEVIIIGSYSHKA